MDITAQELKDRLAAAEEHPLLLDVREGYERDEFNIGGLHIPLGEIGANLDQLVAHRQSEIVVYCRSGKRSAMAKSLLEQAGFTQVRNLEGGMLAYQVD
ncbi:MAG: rhodanese-like domain-containing protein [Lewinella sp.]|nr:rhodanese-like domain-containing protein [Lewinella sp.]